MQRSLLGRIARYGITGLRDPREDRLTEICAAVFGAEACEGLARHVALGWLAAAAAATCSGLELADLELDDHEASQRVVVEEQVEEELVAADDDRLLAPVERRSRVR